MHKPTWPQFTMAAVREQFLQRCAPVPGSGWPLSRIVDLYGGRIVVESQPGAGTHFPFDLPSDSVAA